MAVTRIMLANFELDERRKVSSMHPLTYIPFSHGIVADKGCERSGHIGRRGWEGVDGGLPYVWRLGVLV
jgi:hypothetical protein